MDIRKISATEAAVQRYVEDLWLPYHRDLAAAVEYHELADDEDIDLVAEETEFRLDLLESKTHEIWVAVDVPVDVGADAPVDVGADAPADVGADVPVDVGVDSNTDFAAIDAPLAGYVTTDVDECPAVFDYPDRLVVGDIYVKEPYRGSGIGRDLMAKAADRAQHYDCPELRLDVDVDNERALAFYEKLGFERYRYQMLLEADHL